MALNETARERLRDDGIDPTVMEELHERLQVPVMVYLIGRIH